MLCDWSQALPKHFGLKWDFDAIPLEPQGDESPDRKYCVVVQSTKGEILRSPSPIELSSVEVTATIEHK
jgi:hypothetical protein